MAMTVQHTSLVGTTVYVAVQRPGKPWTWEPHTVTAVYVSESRLCIGVTDDGTGEIRDIPYSYARATPPAEEAR